MIFIYLFNYSSILFIGNPPPGPPPGPSPYPSGPTQPQYPPSQQPYPSSGPDYVSYEH